MEDKNINVNISTVTIFKVFLVLLAVYLVYLLGDLIIILFVSLILASLINPWADWIAKKKIIGVKIPRTVGVILIYIILFSILSFAVYSIIPPIAKEINDFSKDSPAYLEKVFSGISIFKEKMEERSVMENIREGLSAVSSDLQQASGGVFSFVGGLFGGIFSFGLILAITFYMVIEENGMKKVVWLIVPEKHQPYMIQLLGRMQKKVGLWLRGQIILSAILFVVTYLGLSLLGVKYALMLAMLSALAEFIPYLGPILATIPAFIIAFFQSPILAVFVLIFYYVVQIIENNVLVPQIMRRVVGLNPIIIIIVLIVGFKFAGVLGGVLAIPVATAASVFFGDFFHKEWPKEEAV